MYLDTAILVKLVVREPDSTFYAEMVERAQSWPICSNDGRLRQAATRLGFPVAPTPR